jgi:hypothetical protein
LAVASRLERERKTAISGLDASENSSSVVVRSVMAKVLKRLHPLSGGREHLEAARVLRTEILGQTAEVLKRGLMTGDVDSAYLALVCLSLLPQELALSAVVEGSEKATFTHGRIGALELLAEFHLEDPRALATIKDIAAGDKDKDVRKFAAGVLTRLSRGETQAR